MIASLQKRELVIPWVQSPWVAFPRACPAVVSLVANGAIVREIRFKSAERLWSLG
jgi:hypothetical protein